MLPDQSKELKQTAISPKAESLRSTPVEEETKSFVNEHSDSTSSSVDYPVITGYQVIEELARGGMGCVYAAIDHVFDRKVAIKTLLRQSHADRFVTESKITARLPHPNIPPVYAMGTFDSGSPYLVMKLVQGETLAQLLKDRANVGSDTARFVQIFEQISQAVGYAHDQGVVHRDLKPLNIMVGEFGEVQVMDWGLAKDLQSEERQAQDDHEHSPVEGAFVTEAGAVMGTPGYMSPEQARGEEIDARTDVFALGSILATILTGAPAFVGSTSWEIVRKASSDDTSDVLDRLSKSQADPELIQITRKCLATKLKDRPQDAYEVSNLIADYRKGVTDRLRQAETARAEGVVRETEGRKRRRLFNLAAGLVTAVLLVGLAASLWQMNRAVIAEKDAVRERDSKDLALKAEEKAKLAAEERKLEAERNLEFSKNGNLILGKVFEDLNPETNYLTVGELREALVENLTNAIEDLEASSIGEPLDVAEMQTILGNSLIGMGEPGRAISTLESSQQKFLQLGSQDEPAALTSDHCLALAYFRSGQLAKAQSLFEKTLKKRTEVLGENHTDTLISMSQLASLYLERNMTVKAIPLSEEVFEKFEKQLGLKNEFTLTGMSVLAKSYQAAGRYKEALSLFEKLLDIRDKKFGPNDPQKVVAQTELAEHYSLFGQTEKAIPMLLETLEESKSVLGSGHSATMAISNNLALAYMRSGK